MKLFVVVSALLSGVLAFPEDVVPFDMENRITNGVEAGPAQFPYQVGLEMTKVRDGRTIHTWCGGSLISEQAVLTAAHCLDQADSVLVFLGSHNRDMPQEPGRIILKVGSDKLVMHPNYNRLISENDIALIHLPNKVPLSAKIQTINIPSRSQVTEKFANLMGTISGWGRIADPPQNGYTTTLKYAHRTILPDSECLRYYPMFFKPSQICVDGSDRKSACQGDSGGPLAINEGSGKKLLVGLTSYGRPEGCEKGFPVSYTRVSSYLDWIAKETGMKIRA